MYFNPFLVELSERLGDDMTTKFVYSKLAKHGFAAFSARLTPAAVAFLTAHEAVEYVEENREMRIFDCKEQTNADWGTVGHMLYYAYCVLVSADTRGLTVRYFKY